VDDGSAELGIRREYPMVSVAMEAWRWDEANESSEKLEGREHEFRATARCRLGYPTFGGQAIDETGLGRGEGDDAAGSPEPFEREGRPGTVAEQAFDACPVLTLDAYRGVDAEPTGTLPGKHAVGVDFVE